MAKKQFKAESKRLLDMMVNSIYTHREIFLRELISNASDAMDKLYYKARTEHIGEIDRDTLGIDIDIDAVQRTLTVRDNGCGMTKEELETNLGTIAGSGTRAFRGQLAEDADVEMIGQFGVGFYSAFMVADRIEVTSRAFGSNEAYCWASDGADGFTVSPAEKDGHGTDIVLHIRPAAGEDSYDEFLQPYRIAGIVRKYSDYVRYPIRMLMDVPREGADGKTETVAEVQTLNSMVPLWRKNKSEITAEQYNEFYKNKFYDFADPLRVIHSSTEGAATYNALLFVPARKPYNYYSREYEKGLQLYASGVLIMDKCADLLPDYFSFVRGLVDSQDLSLNISREMLQHDRQLQIIATHLEKKIHTELTAMLHNEREKYETFFREFGLQLKYGVYGDYGRNKDRLKDLLLFTSSHEDKPVTLQEYVGRMKEEQKAIYYACGESVDKIRRLPQTEWLLDQGYELLFLTEDVDEFTLKALHDWDGKEFVSASSERFEAPETDEQKEQAQKQDEQNKPMLDFITGALGGKVEAVRLSRRLKSHPVCLTSQGELSLEMERVLNALPAEQKVHAERVLEINASHALFGKLQQLYAEDQEKLALFAHLLYQQALLMEGMPIEDPVDFSNRICQLMIG